jgi:hypothetical protein
VALMKLDVKDPNCTGCVLNTTVELTAGTPCTITVHVVLAPPPTGTTFPTASETVTAAELKYYKGTNSTTKPLGPPTGPDFDEWTSGNSFDITFSAASWLTSSDFATLNAEFKVTTNTRSVTQKWYGIQA